YKMAHENISTFYSGQTINLSFSSLMKNDQSVINNLCNRLSIENNIFTVKQESEKESHISRHNYTTLSELELQHILLEVPFISKYCTEEKT
ncbi:MAG: hypothetical protein KA160_08570, partial [Lacibacter sp.]|nr:hypothetical protein [Lacibacter sp.]